MKLGGGKYRAATEVNVLSPETTIVSVADAFHEVAGNKLITANQREGRIIIGVVVACNEAARNDNSDY